MLFIVGCVVSMSIVWLFTLSSSFPDVSVDWYRIFVFPSSDICIGVVVEYCVFGVHVFVVSMQYVVVPHSISSLHVSVIVTCLFVYVPNVYCSPPTVVAIAVVSGGSISGGGGSVVSIVIVLISDCCIFPVVSFALMYHWYVPSGSVRSNVYWLSVLACFVSIGISDVTK